MNFDIVQKYKTIGILALDVIFCYNINKNT